MPRDLSTEAGRAAHRASQAKYAAAHPERVRKSQREWHRKNPHKSGEYREKFSEQRATATAAWKRRNPEKVLEAKRRFDLKKYGLTLDDYERLLAQQGGHCAACPFVPNPTSRKRYLCVDHDHSSGRVRGLLCSGCNTALGLVRDEVERLLRLAAYVERSRQ